MGIQNKRTKIIATIGPACDTPEMISQLITAGVNVFRFNMKHNSLDWHDERIKLVKSVAAKLDKSVGVYIDLQGPEIRIDIPDPKEINIKIGDIVTFSQSDLGTGLNPKTIFLSQKPVIEALVTGDQFSIDDGLFEFEVTESHGNYFLAKSLDEGVIKSRKGLNLKSKDVNLPSLTTGDLDKLQVAKRENVDFIGLSFARSKEDIDTLRNEMDKIGIKARVIAKVESHRGVENIDEIITHSDCVMVARGDLGIEIPLEKVTYIQKDIINKCRKANKPVIVATQMLESMINSPIPTRAEAADISNAVYDGTDAVMLSGETATGKYPLKAVTVMSRILEFNEEKISFKDFYLVPKDQTQLLVDAAISMIHTDGDIHINKILTFTETGYTARVLSSFRGHTPVIAVCSGLDTVNSLTISYGVTPVKSDFPSGDFILPEDIISGLKKDGLLSEGDLILIIHGRKWLEPGKTNAAVLVTV